MPPSMTAPAAPPVDNKEVTANVPTGADAGPMLEIKLKVSQAEVQEVIQALREIHMDQFADLLEKSLPKATPDVDPNQMTPDQQKMQDQIVGMQPTN